MALIYLHHFLDQQHLLMEQVMVPHLVDILQVEVVEKMLQVVLGVEEMDQVLLLRQHQLIWEVVEVELDLLDLMHKEETVDLELLL
jgi:hypothetical protein